MNLATLVKKYLEIAGAFGRPVHLLQFGFSKAEIEKTFSAFDEDYQISRYMLLTRERDAALEALPPKARVYRVNGYEATHLSFHPNIQKTF